MKAYTGEQKYSSNLHPSLSSLMGAGELSASRPGRITPVERPTVPIQQEYGWIQSRSECFWDKKNFLFLAALEPSTDALPRLPLRDRVYHSPSSFIATDRSLTALPLSLVCVYRMTTLEGMWRGYEFSCTFFRLLRNGDDRSALWIGSHTNVEDKLFARTANHIPTVLQ